MSPRTRVKGTWNSPEQRLLFLVFLNNLHLLSIFTLQPARRKITDFFNLIDHFKSSVEVSVFLARNTKDYQVLSLILYHCHHHPIELVTFPFAVGHSIHWATPARITILFTNNLPCARHCSKGSTFELIWCSWPSYEIDICQCPFTGRQLGHREVTKFVATQPHSIKKQIQKNKIILSS